MRSDTDAISVEVPRSTRERMNETGRVPGILTPSILVGRAPLLNVKKRASIGIPRAESVIEEEGSGKYLSEGDARRIVGKGSFR